uniref:calcitonin gene-related peptide type 1 receptor-like isoform X2 n=1 Tax=Myxine glutinosa TaxID=7769 RepID=UPI00358E8536
MFFLPPRTHSPHLQKTFSAMANLYAAALIFTFLQVESQEDNIFSTDRYIPINTSLTNSRTHYMISDRNRFNIEKKIFKARFECFQKMEEDLPPFKEGPFCNRTWDGWLCWDDTPGGEVAVQNCPNYFPDFDPKAQVTKFCQVDGRWFQHQIIKRTWTNFSSCIVHPTVEFQKDMNIFSTDRFLSATISPTNSTSRYSNNDTTDLSSEEKILKAQFKCIQKMKDDPLPNKEGTFCNRTWDGWLCWEDTPAGEVSVQKCPDYFPDFDPTEKVTKICKDNGQWFQHPTSKRVWSNYTLCNANVTQKLQMALNMFYLTVIGHSLSIITLLISLTIFFHFKSLGCQRITLHKNLFMSYILHSIITIVQLTAVANNQNLAAVDPVWCKVLQFLHQYVMGCNYFWMLCEGIYLHTLIVVAVFAEKQQLCWYFFLGWGFPSIPAIIHAVARTLYYNDNCWISSATHLLYIIHGPFIVALLVNLFFLLNIVRVLVTKLKDTHRAESYMYIKAVRATLILVPLLGIHIVLVPWKPYDQLAGVIYEYVMHILMHYQGLLVATIFCFCNGEVQAVLRRYWQQHLFRLQHSPREHRYTRSASYTASSVTEVPAYLFSKDGRVTCEAEPWLECTEDTSA